MGKNASTVKTISEFVARNQLGSILERVKKNQEPFVVSRKGEATAVILGYEDFLRSILRLKEPAVLKTIRKGAQRSGAAKLTRTEINAEIQAERHQRRTRQVA
jgi:prevent-host-death family protein